MHTERVIRTEDRLDEAVLLAPTIPTLDNVSHSDTMGQNDNAPKGRCNSCNKNNSTYYREDLNIPS